MQKDNWRDINDVLIDNLKKANIKPSHSRKFKKVLLWTIGITVLFVSLAVGILIYNLNKPFMLTVNTNVETNSAVEIKVEKGSLISNLEKVEIEGFEFIGWYKDEEYTQQFNDYELVEQDTVLFAAYKPKQFQIDVPLNDAYEIAIVGATNVVDYGDDFSFTLYANTDYDLAEMQILLNGKVLNPFFSDRHSSQYRIINIREEVILEVAGEIARYVNLNVFIDGTQTSYKVKDTTNLQKILTNIEYDFTEYNTMGLFMDAELTKPANLTQRLLNDITVYTKKSTSINNVNFKWDSVSNSWFVDTSRVASSTLVLPSKYINGVNDGYISKVLGTTQSSNANVQSVYLPSTITAIDSYAFYNFSKLANVTIPTTVSTINNSAFQNCSKLNNIKLPNGTTNIGNFSFENCTSLTSITIPNSLMVIGYYAFTNCSNLQNVEFENNSSLTNIGGMAFAYTGLKEITIPSSVTIIGYNNFYNCTKLTKVVIPNSVTIISDYAFYYCTSLTTVTIPDSVNVIGKYAFAHCRKLSSFTIPKNLSTISSAMFYGCNALASITLPEGVTRVEDSAFSQCSALNSITLPSTLTYIGNSAIYYCLALTQITIPSAVTTIGSSAFSYCTGLTNVTIPSKVTSFSSSVFSNCTNLQKVVFNNSTLTSLGSSTFVNCKNLTSVTLPSSLMSIASSTFQGCASLEKITIPSNVKTISSSAFNGCTNLTQITLPNALTTIDGYAFQNCTALTSINIPGSVTSMGYLPFFGCSNLTNLTLDKQSGYSWKAIRLDSKDIKVLSDNATALQYIKGEKGVYYFKQEKNY